MGVIGGMGFFMLISGFLVVIVGRAAKGTVGIALFLILVGFILMLIDSAGEMGKSSSPSEKEWKPGFFDGRPPDKAVQTDKETGRKTIFMGSRGHWIDKDGPENPTEGSVRSKDGKNVEVFRGADGRWVSEQEFDEYSQKVQQVRAARNRADGIAVIEALKKKH